MYNVLSKYNKKNQPTVYNNLMIYWKFDLSPKVKSKFMSSYKVLPWYRSEPHYKYPKEADKKIINSIGKWNLTEASSEETHLLKM